MAPTSPPGPTSQLLIAEAVFPQFVGDAFVRDPESNVTVDNGYAAWCAWADRRGGFTILNRRWFTTQMRTRGLTAYTLRDSGTPVYVGYRLRPTAELVQLATSHG
jgi:hypothetical protein